jgi:hypothetical protein
MDHIQINSEQAVPAILKILKANLTPMVAGSPGIGKSDIVAQIAKKYNLKLIDVRLAQADPVDLMGYPVLNKDSTRMEYAPSKLFPLEGLDTPEEGTNGWLVFLDELTSAPLSVQSAAYKIILDRKVDQRSIHSKVAFVAAGNHSTDNAIVNRMSTALQSRLVHLNLNVDHQAWLDWANDNRLDHRIISFIKFRPELLHKFDPKHDDNTFASPRTWHFLSKIIQNTEHFDTTDFAVMAGTVGRGAAVEFNTYSSIYQDLPDIDDLIANPNSFNVPREPSHQYAMTTLLSHNMKGDAVDPLMTVLEQLPLEFQTVALRDIHAMYPDLRSHPRIINWVSKNADKLFQ